MRLRPASRYCATSWRSWGKRSLSSPPAHPASRSPNKVRAPSSGEIPRWRCAYRGYRACGRIARLSVAPAGEIPGGAALTGATGACGRIARLSVAPSGEIPGGAALTGATGRRSGCPAKRRASRRNPRWRCAYRGYRACGRVARLSVAPAGAIPGGAALTGATGRRSGCPAKRRASRGDPGRRVTPPARTAA